MQLPVPSFFFQSIILLSPTFLVIPYSTVYSPSFISSQLLSAFLSGYALAFIPLSLSHAHARTDTQFLLRRPENS